MQSGARWICRFLIDHADVAVWAVVFMLVITAGQLAGAQTFSVIHSFTGGGDGANPQAGVTLDHSGNLYGTTYFGGHDRGNCAGTGCGTVFRIVLHNSNWIFTRLYPFTDNGDGDGANSRVIFGPDGTLFGTTHAGNNLFNLKPPPTIPESTFTPWLITVLHQFGNLGDGSFPIGDLVFDQAGNLYGTTYQGGNGGLCAGFGCGTVYQLTPDGGTWTESVLYQFTGGADGYNPQSGVILDQSGNLYGTAQGSFYLGFGWGSVFQLTPSGSGWTENTLYNFEGGADGMSPVAGLIFDSSGNLYGATSAGGAGNGGTVFQLMPSNGAWSFNGLYSLAGGTNSVGPLGSLIMDTDGNLYGTTYSGGANGFGSVFELTPGDDGWTYTSLYDFTGGSDGAYPADGVIMDRSGNLFGTTYAGGVTGAACDAAVNNQCGVVFEITP